MLVVWLLFVVIASASWEVRRIWLADSDVTSSAWQKRHGLLREQLEQTPSDQLQEQFDSRLAQAAAYASQYNLTLERFLDATTAREVRVWQQQQTFAETQTNYDMQQRIHHLSRHSSHHGSHHRGRHSSHHRADP